MSKSAFEAEGRQDQNLTWESHCEVLQEVFVNVDKFDDRSVF